MQNTITRVKSVNVFTCQCHLAAGAVESGLFVRHVEANGRDMPLKNAECSCASVLCEYGFFRQAWTFNTGNMQNAYFEILVVPPELLLISARKKQCKMLTNLGCVSEVFCWLVVWSHLPPLCSICPSHCAGHQRRHSTQICGFIVSTVSCSDHGMHILLPHTQLSQVSCFHFECMFRTQQIARQLVRLYSS